MNCIDRKMQQLVQPMLKNPYGQYILKVVDEVKRKDKNNLK